MSWLGSKKRVQVNDLPCVQESSRTHPQLSRIAQMCALGIMAMSVPNQTQASNEFTSANGVREGTSVQQISTPVRFSHEWQKDIEGKVLTELMGSVERIDDSVRMRYDLPTNTLHVTGSGLVRFADKATVPHNLSIESTGRGGRLLVDAENVLGHVSMSGETSLRSGFVDGNIMAVNGADANIHTVRGDVRIASAGKIRSEAVLGVVRFEERENVDVGEIHWRVVNRRADRQEGHVAQWFIDRENSVDTRFTPEQMFGGESVENAESVKF